MNIQLIYEVVSQYLVGLIAAGGGLVAISYASFKFFASKWLEARFAERLQNLKAEQDQTIRFVQSTIDREIHRAKKLYDSEFTALSECWALLRKAYDQSAATVASFTVQVERMSQEEFERHLAQRGMEDWERNEFKQLVGNERHNAYYRWSEWQRYLKVEQLRREYRSNLDVSSIFFAQGFTEKFRALEDLICSSNIEFEHRIREHGAGGIRAGAFEATNRLRTDGEPMMIELEEMVRRRLWSVAKDGVLQE
jgi:hypothetical protein